MFFRLIFALFIIAVISNVKCEKLPIDCTPLVERLRGFTFCHFSNQSSELHDTTKVKVNPSVFQGRLLESERITAVAISLSDFLHIPSSVFTNFGDVSRLKIMHSKVKEILEEDFTTATHLRVFEVEYTKVGKITSKAFELAKNLEEVKFENCEIEDFADDAFEGLEKLKEIRLTNNTYKNGPPDLSKLPESIKLIH